MTICQESLPYYPVIILVRPQMGENIGAAARAMLNFGFTQMRIVSPRDGWPNQRAVDMSSGALDKMPEPAVFDTLEAALADLQVVYATTARPRDMIKPVYTPQQAVAEMHARQSDQIKTGIVFGGERAGLSNDHVALCQNIITIPVNPDFSSLNLGQAVLLVCYEFLNQMQSAAVHRAPTLDLGKSIPAPQDDLENFFRRLEDGLEAGGFFKSPDMAPTMKRNIRALLTRAQPSLQEINTLHGMITALNKAP